jgi:hypothetical protein
MTKNKKRLGANAHTTSVKTLSDTAFAKPDIKKGVDSVNQPSFNARVKGEKETKNAINNLQNIILIITVAFAASSLLAYRVFFS